MAGTVGNFSGMAWLMPIQTIVSITPGSTFNPPALCRALYVSAQGDVTLTMADGTSKTIPALAAGIWHPIAFSAVASYTGGGTILGGA